MTIYLSSVYEDPKLRREFETAYRKTGKKLDMGGSCVHFKTLDDLPLEVVGDDIARVSVDEYVERYERLRPTNPKKTKKVRASATGLRAAGRAVVEPTPASASTTAAR